MDVRLIGVIVQPVVKLVILITVIIELQFLFLLMVIVRPLGLIALQSVIIGAVTLAILDQGIVV